MPPAPSRPPTAPDNSDLPHGIPPRKVILAVILAGSIVFFFLILFAGLIAVLREASPHGHAPALPFLFVLKRRIAHYLRILHRYF